MYPSEIVDTPPRDLGDPLTFKPTQGGAATVDGYLRWEGQRDVIIDGISVKTWYVKLVENFIFRNVKAGAFFIRSSSQVKVIGGSVGDNQDGTSPTIGISEASAPLTRDILIDGVSFDNIGRAECEGCHVECLFIQEAANVVIRNSRFTRCDVMDIFVEGLFGTQPTNLTLENNWFDEPTSGGYYPVYIRWDPGRVISGYVIRYNSFNGSLHLDEGTYQNVSIYANVGNMSICVPGVEVGATTCGGTCGARQPTVGHHRALAIRRRSTFDRSRVRPRSMLATPSAIRVSTSTDSRGPRESDPMRGQSSTGESCGGGRVRVSRSTAVSAGGVTGMRRRRLLALYLLSRRVQTKILSLIAGRGFARFGARSAIEPPLRIVGAFRVSVGDDVFIGSGSWLQVVDADTGSDVAIEIGDGCEISGGLVISSAEKVVIGRRGADREERLHRRPSSCVR